MGTGDMRTSHQQGSLVFSRPVQSQGLHNKHRCDLLFSDSLSPSLPQLAQWRCKPFYGETKQNKL